MQASPPSTTPILLSERTGPLLLDDRALVALIAGEALPLATAAECFTTTYFCYRACRAVVLGARGHLSGPFARLDQSRRAWALQSMLVLPAEVRLPEPRAIVPMMVDVQRRHPHLNVLSTEAAAAALVLRATMVITRATVEGQLGAVLHAEGVDFDIVDLP